MVESVCAMLLHHAPTQHPARPTRQWTPPSIPPTQLASGSRQVSCQSCSPVDPGQYPAMAARQWIPPSIPPELLASGSWIPPSSSPVDRRVSRQSSSPEDPAKYPARAARQWIPPTIPIPPSIPPELLASESRQVSRQQLASASAPPERLANGSRPVNRQRCLPVDPAKYPARAARQWIPPSTPPASGSRRVSR